MSQPDEAAAREWMLLQLGATWVTVDTLPETKGVLPHEVGSLGPWHGFRIGHGKEAWGWASTPEQIDWELSRRVEAEVHSSSVVAFLAGAAHGRADQQEADNKLRSAAEILLYQIERAGGLLKLSNAVELGATSWLVHTLDAFERIEDAIRADKPETT